MSGFSADWLALREPFDAAARATPLVTELKRHLVQGTPTAPLEVVDLGAGAGSNLRYLHRHLGGWQRWRLVDHDRELLHHALVGTFFGFFPPSGPLIDRRLTDTEFWVPGLVCSAEPRDLSGGALGDLVLPNGGLVTAAALLDLVSPEWLDTLAKCCRAARAAVCFALTYDGRTQCTPDEPEDALVLELFNRHQRLDKGFGPALGPGAAQAAERQFASQGYRVMTATSDWDIAPQHADMQRALLDGWLGAALEIAPQQREILGDWHRRRCAHVAAGHSRLVVGHIDLVGWL